MKKLYIILLIILQANFALAKIRVAVLDTGVSKSYTSAPLCVEALPDSSDNKHGTSVIELINQNAGNVNYCVYSLKIFDKKFNHKTYLMVLKLLINLHVDVINMSFTGLGYDAEEAKLIKKLLDQGTTIFAAAGNNSDELSNDYCNIYPACIDPRIVIVGSESYSSGYGNRVRIKSKYDSIKIAGKLIKGTSQATAIETGRFVKFLGKHGF